MPVLPVVAMQRFDLKNSSIAIKLSYSYDFKSVFNQM